MGIELSVSARTEITAKYARAYRAASRVVKSRLLDEVVAVTGWSRDNARRRLGQAVKPRAVRPRSGRPRKFSKEATAILERVWAISGGSCGKYLAVAMPHLLEALEAHGELVSGQRRYCREVRGELLGMSAATIDRYLAAAKARGALRGVSTTKPGTLLRNSITIRKAGDEVEADPGFFEADTVAHCGPTLKGEFARTVNLTDMVTGWVFTTAVRNNARVHIIAALDRAVATIPFPIAGLDFDNGSEFINHDLVAWAGERDIFFTRSRPYRKNDQATIESKNNHLVRRYGFHWRYDTPEALMLLNRLWPLVNDRFNYFTPTKKPTGWATTATGRRKRLYDAPRTPLERLLDAGVLSTGQAEQLIARRAAINPAELARDIQRLQDQLTGLAKHPTLDLVAATTRPLPDTTRGVKLRSTA
jgi:transposase InsO family protein